MHDGIKTSAGLDNRQPYLGQQPLLLAALATIVVAFFLVVTGLSHAYHAQRESIGNRWFGRGIADLNAGHFDSAVMEFRSALLYSRDNYSYQLNLAEALIGQKRGSEAYSYLINLWDRQPENGLVNLELARIAAQRTQNEQALRYYRNAVYAAWPADQEGQRRDARVELIAFLLRTNARSQAESELIALEENMGNDPSQQVQIGDLFVRTLDYERALSAYRLSLKSDRHNSAAEAGAGLAAFELGRYSLAHRYLQSAVAADPSNQRSTDLLATTELVLQMDPYRRPITIAQRNRLVVAAFVEAGARIKSCGTTKSALQPSISLPNLADGWAKMKPRITEQELRRDPDLVEPAMELVFNIERQTSAVCGTPTGPDLALLLIAQLHEGN